MTHDHVPTIEPLPGLDHPLPIPGQIRPAATSTVACDAPPSPGTPSVEVQLLHPHCELIGMGQTRGKGRGIFAVKPIHEGELIERVPVLFLSNAEADLLEKTRLRNYVYDWGEPGVALALGYGGLYNHSYAPNAMYVKHYMCYLLEFVAIRTIQPGEEITVNYNGRPDDPAPIWFDVVEG